MKNKGIILNDDILYLIGDIYKKNKYWDLSLNNRKAKEFWIKKYTFDQLFVLFLHRYDGKIYTDLKALRHSETNNGNHYDNYTSLNICEDSPEYEKINHMNLRYHAFNEIIFYKNIKPSKFKMALQDKKHYLDVEEYIDCTQFIYALTPYKDYKYCCFNGEGCHMCNRITEYDNRFLNLENLITFL